MIDPHDEIRAFWDRDAETYDRSPSHSGTEPLEAAAWRAALLRHLPPQPARILEVGVGTGTMSLMAADLGYRVTGLDLSPGMLAAARKKAESLGVEQESVIGSAEEPPPGPFDAVIVRHLMWTLPDPVAALRAWRAVATRGRLVLYEGVFARVGRAAEVRRRATEFVRKAYGILHEHRGEYSPELLAALPLAGAATPAPMLEAVGEAGWQQVQLERLRDVEWARRTASPPLLGWLESVPRFAVLAQSNEGPGSAGEA
jgi:SAM-dependent methyltransferase